MLGLGGGLGFNSVPIDNGTLILSDSEVHDRLLGDSDEAMQLGLEMSSMSFFFNSYGSASRQQFLKY